MSKWSDLKELEEKLEQEEFNYEKIKNFADGLNAIDAYCKKLEQARIARYK